MERAQVSTVREQLIKVREALGSQEALAAKVGVDRMTIHRWEQGLSFPRPRRLRKLCEVTEKTAAELGFGEEADEEAEKTTEEHLEDAEELEEPKDPELLKGEEYEGFRESSLMLRLFLCVRNYPRNGKARYHELQVLMTLEQRDNKMDTNELSRREACKFIATLPVECCGLSALKPVFKESYDEILLRCGAGITACWGLRKTQEITFAAQTAAKYIPTLKEIAAVASAQQRREAAELLFQCFLLLMTHSMTTIVGAHNAVAYALQAEKYSKQAENPLLEIIALRAQAGAYEYTGDWKSALCVGQKAKGLLETTRNMAVPLLVDSYVHAGLSNYQAFFGLKDDAKSSLKRARAAFDAQSQGESVSLWIDHSIGNLLINDGRMHMHLGLYTGAIDSLEKMDGEYAHDASIPFGIRIEATIDCIIAELSRTDKPRNMDWCIDNWQKSLNDAKVLGSRSKENKVIQVYGTMLGVWSGEKEVLGLRERLM